MWMLLSEINYQSINNMVRLGEVTLAWGPVWPKQCAQKRPKTPSFRYTGLGFH